MRVCADDARGGGIFGWEGSAGPPSPSFSRPPGFDSDSTLSTPAPATGSLTRRLFRRRGPRSESFPPTSTTPLPGCTRPSARSWPPATRAAAAGCCRRPRTTRRADSPPRWRPSAAAKTRRCCGWSESRARRSSGCGGSRRYARRRRALRCRHAGRIGSTRGRGVWLRRQVRIRARRRRADGAACVCAGGRGRKPVVQGGLTAERQGPLSRRAKRRCAVPGSPKAGLGSLVEIGESSERLIGGARSV